MCGATSHSTRHAKRVEREGHRREPSLSTRFLAPSRLVVLVLVVYAVAVSVVRTAFGCVVLVLVVLAVAV